jgi:tRNA U34 5-methylaminomethyl-2-thiouridine-forming methyltransferase MnmC
MSLKEEGNKYVLVKTDLGVPTFKHVATSEVLHGQVGPYEEATHLYVKYSNILEFKQNVVVYDLGMGCGAQLIAMYRAFLSNKNITKFTVVSFDLEKEGLAILSENIKLFPYVAEFYECLTKCLTQNHFIHCLNDGRKFEWFFIEGDFQKTIARAVGTYPLADIICYDFFSPASQPHLWTYEVFSHLKKHMASISKIITYSSATCIRATMLAVGLYVGFGPISGKKSKSTIASTLLSQLEDPLPIEWKKTFERSGAKFCEGETEKSKQNIICTIETHLQWSML